jgi:hypothetical protein
MVGGHGRRLECPAILTAFRVGPAAVPKPSASSRNGARRLSRASESCVRVRIALRKKIRRAIRKTKTQNTQKIRSFPVLSVFLLEYAEYAKKYAKYAKSGNKTIKYAEYALPTGTLMMVLPL